MEGLASKYKIREVINLRHGSLKIWCERYGYKVSSVERAIRFWARKVGCPRGKTLRILRDIEMDTQLKIYSTEERGAKC
jgi:hypothetical protein